MDQERDITQIYTHEKSDKWILTGNIVYDNTIQ